MWHETAAAVNSRGIVLCRVVGKYNSGEWHSFTCTVTYRLTTAAALVLRRETTHCGKRQ